MVAEVGTTVRRATVDVDATVIESWERAAKGTYTGVKGYQPVVAVWAEADETLATEYRDGNVSSGWTPRRCVRAAFAQSPARVS